jgi:hypothetical protein
MSDHPNWPKTLYFETYTQTVHFWGGGGCVLCHITLFIGFNVSLLWIEIFGVKLIVLHDISNYYSSYIVK